jgi:DNA-binding NarL/FixJ family response regulator
MGRRSQQQIMISRIQSLSPRQKQVKALIERGLSVKEIAGAVGLSDNTIKKHRKNLYKRLRVNSALEVASLAKAV